MIQKNFITSILNINEDDIEDIDIVRNKDKLIIHLKIKDFYPPCPYCDGEARIKEYRNTKIHLTDIASLETEVDLKRRRYICKDCKRTFMEINPLGPKNTNVSWLTITGVMKDLMKPNETYTSIASRHHISATRVQMYADSFLVVPRLKLTKSIGIDELHAPNIAKRNSPYLAILVDNTNRDLLDILPSRSKSELSRYFSDIPKSEKDVVEYVTIDMWEAYKDIADIYLPKAKVTIDPFHLVQNLSRAFDAYRISLMKNQIVGSKSYYLLKKWHYLLESDKYDFNPNAKKVYNRSFNMYLNYHDIRNLLLNLDPVLKTAYELKESFRSFIKETKANSAKEELEKLIKEFEYYDLPLYRNFTASIKKWKQEIINSFDCPYDTHKQTNALAENINGRLGELIGISNGLSNFERLRARALYIFNKKVTYSVTDTFHSKKYNKKPRGKYNK